MKSTLIFFAICTVLLVILWNMTKILKFFRDRKKLKIRLEVQYMSKYLWIQNKLYEYKRDKQCSITNYKFMINQFIELNNLPYKNSERTYVLFNEFLRAFEKTARALS